jgi:hypothetical protein
VTASTRYILEFIRITRYRKSGLWYSRNTRGRSPKSEEVERVPRFVSLVAVIGNSVPEVIVR